MGKSFSFIAQCPDHDFKRDFSVAEREVDGCREIRRGILSIRIKKRILIMGIINPKRSIWKPEPFQYSFHRVIVGRVIPSISVPGLTEMLLRAGGYGPRLKRFWKNLINIEKGRYRNCRNYGN